jgi:hypothetical protein
VGLVLYDEGRRKKEEGRRKKEEGKCRYNNIIVSVIQNVLTVLAATILVQLYLSLGSLYSILKSKI